MRAVVNLVLDAISDWARVAAQRVIPARHILPVQLAQHDQPVPAG